MRHLGDGDEVAFIGWRFVVLEIFEEIALNFFGRVLDFLFWRKRTWVIDIGADDAFTVFEFEEGGDGVSVSGGGGDIVDAHGVGFS